MSQPMRTCGECHHLQKYHENVYVCPKKKNTIPKTQRNNQLPKLGGCTKIKKIEAVLHLCQ